MIVLATGDAGTAGHPDVKIESGEIPYILHKINLKCIIDLNVKHKTF